MQKHIEQLMDAMSDLVAAGEPWQEKREAVEKYCANDDRLKGALEEFTSWWSG